MIEWRKMTLDCHEVFGGSSKQNIGPAGGGWLSGQKQITGRQLNRAKDEFNYSKCDHQCTHQSYLNNLQYIDLECRELRG